MSSCLPRPSFRPGPDFSAAGASRAPIGARGFSRSRGDVPYSARTAGHGGLCVSVPRKDLLGNDRPLIHHEHGLTRASHRHPTPGRGTIEGNRLPIPDALSGWGSPRSSANRVSTLVLDQGVCTGCGQCEHRCPFGAISMDDVPVIDPGKCLGCGNCVAVCPVEALVMEKEAA